jgi:hypothetical protein
VNINEAVLFPHKAMNNKKMKKAKTVRTDLSRKWISISWISLVGQIQKILVTLLC